MLETGNVLLQAHKCSKVEGRVNVLGAGTRAGKVNLLVRGTKISGAWQSVLCEERKGYHTYNYFTATKEESSLAKMNKNYYYSSAPPGKGRMMCLLEVSNKISTITLCFYLFLFHDILLLLQHPSSCFIHLYHYFPHAVSQGLQF